MCLTLLILVVAILTSVFLQQNCIDGLNLSFYQSDYDIKFERAQVVNFNKNYVTHMNIVTFKFNRTCTAFNLSYAYKKTEIELTKLAVTIQAYKFASNEYRLFPIRFQIHMCDLYNENMGGMGYSKCRNFQGCPTELGKEYYICNFTPDKSKFPPLIPSGRYMLELQANYNDTDLWNIRGTGEIFRSILKK